MPKKPSNPDAQLIPLESIQQRIYLIRGHKVMLDSDLAELYGVGTKQLNQQVTRNKERFPEDFMFPLGVEEWTDLRSQIATSSSHGGRRYRPRVFTEQGVAMLSSVLRSQRAIHVNIAIMRVFVKIRTMLASHANLLRRLDEMEEKYDEQFRVVFEAIRELMTPAPIPPSRRIGFNTENDE